jgi:ubiquinone/menaquinone biosynthesis C-methylase UbiE
MQQTESMFTTKKLSSNSIFSHKTRRMSQNSKLVAQDSPDLNFDENSQNISSISPSQRKVAKKQQYLYKRLEGT